MRTTHQSGTQTISGLRHTRIRISQPDSLTITATGTLAPFTRGANAIEVTATSGVSISNAGTIICAAGVDGTHQTQGGRGGIGVDITGSANLVNTGLIEGGAGGRGAVGGLGGVGVYLNAGTLTNAGTIAGGLGGIAWGQGFHNGIGAAVLLGSGPAQVIYDAGAQFDGAVVGNLAAADTLTLAGTTPGYIRNFSDEFSGFRTLTESAGSTWTLDDATQLTGVQTIDVAGDLSTTGYFNINSAIDLTGTLATTGYTFIGVGASTSLGGTLENSGTITALGILSSTGVVLNSGVITNVYYGVHYDGNEAALTLSGGTLSNSGSIVCSVIDNHKTFTISGSTGAVLIDSTGVNTGLILGGVGRPAYGVGYAGGTGLELDGGSFVNSGRIQGGAGGPGYSSYYHPAYNGAGGVGVYLNGASLTNSGTIACGAPGGEYGHVGPYPSWEYTAAAVQFGSRAATLSAYGNSVFLGNIDGNASVADTLALLAGAPGTLSAASISGITNIIESAGSTWTIDSNVFVGAGETLTTDGNLTISHGIFDLGGTLRGGVTLEDGTLIVSNLSALDDNITLTDGGTLVLPGGDTFTFNGLFTGAIGIDGYNELVTGANSSSRIIGVNTIAPDQVLLNEGTMTLTGTLANAGVIAAAGKADGLTGIDISNGTLTNSGEIFGGDGYSAFVYGQNGGAGVRLDGGLIVNTGSITGGQGGYGNQGEGDGYGGAGVYLSRGTLVNAGTIASGGLTARFQNTGGAIDFGNGPATLIVDPGAVFVGVVAAKGSAADTLVLTGSTAATLTGGIGAGGEFTGFSTITETAGAIWTLTGASNNLGQSSHLTASGTLTFLGTMINYGRITSASGGDIDIKGAVTAGLGTFAVSAGGTIEFDSTVSHYAPFAFSSGGGQLALADPGQFSASIHGFAAGDTIDLLNIAANGETFANGVLGITENGSTIAQLTFDGHYSSSNFSLSADGHGGTVLSFS